MRSAFWGNHVMSMTCLCRAQAETAAGTAPWIHTRKVLEQTLKTSSATDRPTSAVCSPRPRPGLRRGSALPDRRDTVVQLMRNTSKIKRSHSLCAGHDSGQDCAVEQHCASRRCQLCPLTADGQCADSGGAACCCSYCSDPDAHPLHEVCLLRNEPSPSLGPEAALTG